MSFNLAHQRSRPCACGFLMVAKNHDTSKPTAAVGRPRIVLSRAEAAEALYLLSLGLSVRKVARRIRKGRQWLADAYRDRRLHQMAAPQRGGGEIPRPSSFLDSLAENSPEDGEW